MSIRPIDLQVVVQKSADIGKNYTHDSTNTNAAQQSFAQNLQKEVRQTSEQVNFANKTEQNNIDQNGSSGNKYMSKKRGRKDDKEQSENDKSKRKASSTSLFDMSI